MINPLVMIASDGVSGHPRDAGTYSRVLARYVRAQHSLTLMDVVRKMSLWPAWRLETSTLQGRNLGRLQEGKTADVVVFDPEKITDRSTYSAPNQPSIGVRYLLVGGSVVIDKRRGHAQRAPRTRDYIRKLAPGLLFSCIARPNLSNYDRVFSI